MITNADQDTLASFLNSMQSYNMDELKSLGLNFDQGLTATADPNMLLMKRSPLPLSEEPELTPLMQPATPQDQRVPTNLPGPGGMLLGSELIVSAAPTGNLGLMSTATSTATTTSAATTITTGCTTTTPTTSAGAVLTKRSCGPMPSSPSPPSSASSGGPPNGKKTKGRVKIKMEFINNKLRRYTTFSKRKTGIMKKAYELSTLTGTQVMLLVASETGHVYTFATRKLQPMITSESGKQLIQTCLNSPDESAMHPADQRMAATGYEETDLSYNILGQDATTAVSSPEDVKEESSSSGSDDQEGDDNGSEGDNDDADEEDGGNVENDNGGDADDVEVVSSVKPSKWPASASVCTAKGATTAPMPTMTRINRRSTPAVVSKAANIQVRPRVHSAGHSLESGDLPSCSSNASGQQLTSAVTITDHHQPESQSSTSDGRSSCRNTKVNAGTCSISNSSNNNSNRITNIICSSSNNNNNNNNSSSSCGNKAHNINHGAMALNVTQRPRIISQASLRTRTTASHLSQQQLLLQKRHQRQLQMRVDNPSNRLTATAAAPSRQLTLNSANRKVAIAPSHSVPQTATPTVSVTPSSVRSVVTTRPTGQCVRQVVSGLPLVRSTGNTFVPAQAVFLPSGGAILFATSLSAGSPASVIVPAADHNASAAASVCSQSGLIE